MILVLAPSPALDVTYLLDRVEAGAIHRPREVIRQAGGKGLNLARAAVTLGVEVRVVAGLGGAIGALVGELAERDGIRLSVVTTATETRECVSAIPDDGAAPTEFYEPALELDDADWRGVEAAVAHAELSKGDWIVVAGRLPATGVDRAAGMLVRGRERGARVAVDSSGGSLARLLDAVRPELVKVNRVEAAEVVGSDASAGAEALARALRERTGGIAVVTDGAAGAVGADAAGAWRAHPDPQPGRFAIGSGDSFFAGLLAALGRSASLPGSLPQALLAASAAGSANTRMPGAARFDAVSVAEAAARIRVEEVPA